MLRKFAAVLLHLSMLALVCAIAAYWAIRILTPAPTSMPPPQPAAALREADPNLAARMFGLVQAAPAAQQALNVQALGAYAAGRDSAAVLVVDGKPARVYLINQEVVGGAKLVEVRKDAVTIEQAGVRREIALPPQPALGLGGSPPPPGYTREGSTLTAPSVAGAVQPAVAQPRPLPPRQPLIQQPIPQMPPVQQPAQPPQSQLQPQAIQPEQAEAASEDSSEGGLRRQARGRALAQ
jgi:general secretion pathway protein C